MYLGTDIKIIFKYFCIQPHQNANYFINNHFNLILNN